MKVFLSWSGPTSGALASALHAWLPNVLQSVTPFLSSEDVDKGARWAEHLGKELESTGYGILCVTQENSSAPWLNFEAGALSKSVDTSRVVPLLLDLAPADLTGPLTLFQMTTTTKSDMYRLVQSINRKCPEPLDEARVSAALDQWWPALETELERVRSAAPTALRKNKRDVGEMVEEVLVNVRGLQRDLQGLAHRQDSAQDRKPNVVSDRLHIQKLAETLLRRGLPVTSLATTVDEGVVQIALDGNLTLAQRTFLERVMAADGRQFILTDRSGRPDFLSLADFQEIRDEERSKEDLVDKRRAGEEGAAAQDDPPR